MQKKKKIFFMVMYYGKSKTLIYNFKKKQYSNFIIKKLRYNVTKYNNMMVE